MNDWLGDAAGVPQAVLHRIRGVAPVALALLLTSSLGLMLSAGDAPPDPAATKDAAAQVHWSLAGQGTGVSKLSSISRDGRKFDLLLANGGNTLTVERKTGAAKNKVQRVTLKCELLLAEYDSATRAMDRILCVGGVEVRLTDGTAEASQESYLAGECLEFKRSEEATGPADQAAKPLGFGAWTPLQGSWTLAAIRPATANLPAEFAEWIKSLPPMPGGRALLRTDRMTLLAPRIDFKPLEGVCEAGPDQVTGAFEGEPVVKVGTPAPATAPTEKPARTGAGWKPERRTRFSCRSLSAQFVITPEGALMPRGDLQMTGQVWVAQEVSNGKDGAAEIAAERLAVHYPKDRDHLVIPPAGAAWSLYETITMEALDSGREILLRDDDMAIHGGSLQYARVLDTGELRPLAGQKWVINEMNLPGEPAGTVGIPGPSRMFLRMRAQGFKFHLLKRDFEAIGERLLEQIPQPVPAP